MCRFIRTVSVMRLLLLGVCCGGAGAAALGIGAQAANGAASGGGMTVQTVCFSIYNGSDRFPTTLYGLRYTNGNETGRTPAIVLVHGYASSTANWDFTPNWSVARKLVQQGYVVISYDRPGFARSPYAGDPTKLGTFYQRDDLHQVVMQVRHGTYLVANQDSCSPSVPKTQSALASSMVVIVGHSQGGAIVQGYPGAYHDVSAMIQSDISGPMIQAPPNPIPTPPPPPTFPPDPRVPTPPPGYAQFFNNRQACEAFNVNWKGAVQDVVDIACDPTEFVYSPNPTVDPQGAPTPQQLIPQTGPIPVLLTWGDSDIIAPIYNDELQYQYWLQNCHCDVSRLYLPDTGHLFMVHKSLNLWISWVTTWLSEHGLAPTAASASAAARTATHLARAERTRGRCFVPRLKGLTVAAATAKLAKANCEVGRTRGRRRRDSRPIGVVSQSRKPGARLRGGTAINLGIA